MREPTSGLEPLYCSLRVIHHPLQGVARACKSRISRRLSLLGVAACCTVLRSRWYQNGPGTLLSLPSTPSSFQSSSETPCLVRLTVELEEDPPVGAYRTFGYAQRLTETPCEQNPFSEEWP